MVETLEEKRRRQCAEAANMAHEVQLEMGGTPLNITEEISRLRKTAAEAAMEVVACNKEIEKLQKICPHDWKFSRQVNDHHEHHWNVTYKCAECDAERTEKSRPPVCEACNSSLQRAPADDNEAEKERVKKKYRGRWNSPIAFRCPKLECRKIHILWHEGD